MTPRFGRLARLFGRRFFGGFQFEPGDADLLKERDTLGAVIYVMRYSSRLDYFLFNWLFLASGLRLSSFANGIRFFYYRPLLEALRLLIRRPFQLLREGRRGLRERGLVRLRQVVRGGGSAFLFLRSDKLGSRVRARAGAVAAGRSELDYLREIVDQRFTSEDPVSLVPLVLFWRKGARPQRAFLTLFYGGPERPTDFFKVVSFLWNYRNLTVRVGTPIDLAHVIDERRSVGREQVVRQVRRALLIFLRREEKPVLGAALRSFERVQDVVLSDAQVVAAIEEDASANRRSLRRSRARARRNLGEIAARQSPTMLAILGVVVGAVFRRVFARFEVHGIDRVIEAAKLHPMVLVPSHRSHFDYLILSWLFYRHHLVPPHVAAGINLAFWPLGPVFRSGGAFFLRRTFDGDRLYSAVFRSYVKLLIRDGATQEFFIEGTRSRTGKTLQPRLGMLRMVLEAYASGVRRELYIVPVAFTYERLVEEGSMVDERRGMAKTAESLLGLIRARSVLRGRFGSVTVRFGQPIAASESVPVGSAARSELPDLRNETEKLGLLLSRQLNDLTTAGRSAVSSAALLGRPAEGLREESFVARVEEVARLLELLGVPRSGPLQRCLEEDDPAAVAELLLQSGLVVRSETPRGALLRIAEGRREALDYYRCTILPALAWPAVVALAARESRRRSELAEQASVWLELLRLEVFPVDDPARAERIASVLAHFVARGWLVECEGERLAPTAAGGEWLEFLGAQLRPLLEAYRAVLQAVADAGGKGERRVLLADAGSVIEEQIVTGEALHAEANSSITQGNVLSLLLADGVLRCDGNPARPDAVFEPGPSFADLGALRARVAAALETR